ncbi:hypothetical protein [Paraburkholderia tropica]|uniref:hypothetical protein n=1 Tax=Paraburkholderia tropica TaxID=92647 RepID=UPI002AB5EC1F|nr:hypothetical protein [Paraburkholderia tropica]
MAAMTVSDWSGIVQGVGSIVAVIAAVGIYGQQYNDKKAEEREEIKAFVQAVRDEIRSLWSLYDRQVGPALRGLKDGEAFRYFYPVSADALTFYNNAASHVGKVNDAELRRLIVETYAIAKGIISSFQMNNHLLTDYENLLTHYQQADRGTVLESREVGLVQYTIELKRQGDVLDGSVAALLSKIDGWLERN